MISKRRAVAYVDSYRLRKEYGSFRDAQEQFDKEVRAWNDELAQLEREVQGLEQSFMEESCLFDDSERQQRVRKIQQQRQDFQRVSNEIFGPEGKAEKRNEEMTRPVLEKINHALSRVADMEGCDLIFDSVSGGLAFGRKDLDLTDRVLEELNSEV